MKKLMDFVGAVVGVLFMGLLTPFIALAIFLEDGLPVLIKIRRVSKGHIIGVYKFRSMVRHADKLKESLLHLNERSDGPLFKMRRDPRVTRVGRFIRRFRLDELPQFVNVLKGELSIVGPRPHEPEEAIQYPAKFHKIHTIKGGVTGHSQVNGNSNLPFRRELELDLHYVENQSIWMDLKILLKTVMIFLFKPDGI